MEKRIFRWVSSFFIISHSYIVLPNYRASYYLLKSPCKIPNNQISIQIRLNVTRQVCLWKPLKKNGPNWKAWNARINYKWVDRFLVCFEHEFREFCYNAKHQTVQSQANVLTNGYWWSSAILEKTLTNHCNIFICKTLYSDEILKGDFLWLFSHFYYKLEWKRIKCYSESRKSYN